MELGGFSISLAVKDLKTSKAFYEKLGFEVFGGEPSHHYLIMKNGTTNIGLFQGMFEGNMLTFNPGWDQNADEVGSYTDVRALRQQLASKGIEIAQETGTGESGPASFTVVDPDDNAILIDQHI